MNKLDLASILTLSMAAALLPTHSRALEALTYQQALTLCSRGYADACYIALQHEQQNQPYNSPYPGQGYGGGSPADAWINPNELTHGGVDGVRPGALTTYDFIR